MTITFTTGSCKVPSTEESASGAGGASAAATAASGSRKLHQASATGAATGSDRCAPGLVTPGKACTEPQFGFLTDCSYSQRRVRRSGSGGSTALALVMRASMAMPPPLLSLQPASRLSSNAAVTGQLACWGWG